MVVRHEVQLGGELQRVRTLHQHVTRTRTPRAPTRPRTHPALQSHTHTRYHTDYITNLLDVRQRLTENKQVWDEHGASSSPDDSAAS